VPLIVMLLGLVDLGFRSYIASQLQGTMDQAARKVTIGGVSTTTVTNFVSDRIRRILPGATVVVVPKSYDDFSDVGKPEPITTDTAPLGVYNAGDCFTDLNANGVWDSDGGQSGNGGGDDIVYYTATVSYPALMPLRKLLGWSATETVSATMMMRNQPYAAQPQPATICT
jgi:Flp pilus assembly protein TadG